MTENQLTAQPLIPWEDFSAAVGVDRMPIPDRLATFKNYTAYVNEYGKELDAKTPEEGKPAMRDWTAQQNDWATKERDSMLTGDFVSWQDVEKSPSFQNATKSDRLRSFENYTNYFEDYADLKSRNTPDPATDEWAKAQREWLMGGMDQAVEQYTLGGKIFSMAPMEQIDFLRTKDQSIAAGFTEEEWGQTREQFEDSMVPLLEKYAVASGATSPMERGASGLESKPKYSPPEDPAAKKEFWKNVLWNEPKKGVVNEIIERLPFESVAGIMSMVSGLTDAMSRDLGGMKPGGSGFAAGTGERRSNAVSQTLGRLSEATANAVEKGRADYPFDPRFSSDEQTIVSAVGQAPGQMAPFMIPGVGPFIGMAGMYGQINQEAQNKAYQAALENKYKESVLAGSTPIGTPVAAWEKTLDSDVREDLRAKVAVQSAVTAIPATAVDYIATKMLLGLQAVPGARSVSKWLSKFREAKPGLGAAAKVGTDFFLRTAAGTASEVVQQGMTNLNAATISRDFSLGSLSEGFREAAIGGVFGEGTMAFAGVKSSIQEQNRFLWAKGVLSGAVNPNLDPRLANLRQGMYAAEATEKTNDPEYRTAAKTWAAKQDEAHWVLRSIGDPEFNDKSADRHVRRATAQGTFRNNLMQYLRDSGVQSSEDILRQRDADLEAVNKNIANLREMHRGSPTESGVNAFEENLTRSANEKAAAAVSKAEEKLQEFIGSVAQDGPGRADYARLVISNKFTDSDFLFSPEFDDDSVVTEILDGIEQDLITDETNLAEWLQAPATQTAPAATTATTPPATQGLLTTGQRRDAIREANFNYKKASPEVQTEVNGIVDDVRFWDAILNDKDSNEQDKAEAMERLPDLENALLELATNPDQVSSQSPNPNDQNQTPNKATVPPQEVSATGAASAGTGAGTQTIRATNADGTQADYSQEDYAEESRATVRALEEGKISPEMALQIVESVRQEIEAAPDLTPEQKAQWGAPFQNIPALVEQRTRTTQQAEPTAPAQQAPTEFVNEQPTPTRLNGVSGDVVRTEAGETVFRSAIDGAETVLRVKETSVDKDPAALAPEDFESGDGTPLVSEADKQFSVLPQSERLVRPFFRTQPQNTEGGETPNEIQTQSQSLPEGRQGSPLPEGRQGSPEGQSGSQGQSQVVTSSQGAGATPGPAAAPDIAAITADVQANPDIHRFKDGNRKLVSREAAVATLSQLPDTLTNKDVATLAKDSGMTSINFRKLAALRGDQNAVGSILNGDMDAELGLFDDTLLNTRRERYAAKVPLNDTTPAAKVSNDTNTESTVVGQSSVDRWVNDSFTAIEQAAANLPQSSINATLFREKLTTDEGRAEIREKLGQMFNTVFRNLKISDPVVREEALEKIFRGALQKQTGEGLTSNVLQDLLTNLKKTGNPFLVKSKNGEVGYSAWLKHRNKQKEFMEAQGKRDMTGTLVENQGSSTTASQGVQDEEGEGSGPAFTEGDPEIEAGRAEAESMIREATQRTYENISREIAKQYGLDWEAVRVAITKSYEDAPAPKRISQQPTPVQIGATQGRVFRNEKGEVVFAPANKSPEIPLQIKKSSLSKPYERLTTQDFETANGESIQTTGVKQDFEGLGWATPQSAKIKKAAAALEATMPQIKQRLWSEMTVALRAAAQEANDLGLLKSDAVEISGTPTLEQLITLGVIDETQNPDFYNAINEAREKKSPEALIPLLERFSQNDIASLQVVTGIVLNSGKPLTNKERLANLNKTDMQEVLDSNLLPVRLRQTLQALVDLSGEDGLGLVRNSKNEGFRRLAELYTEQIGNRAPVEVVFNFGLNPAVTGQGFWASGSNRVHISPFLTREKGLMEATILHEVMHPIWDRKITDFLDGRTDKLTENEQKTITELQQLFDLAKVEAAKQSASITDPTERERMERDLLGAQDLREFLNEALNHRPFQDFLNGIKDPNAAGKTSVWRSILNKILELIRGGKVSLDSVLQRSFELSVDLANYTEREVSIEQRNPKQLDYVRQLEREKGRPLTPREIELAAVDFALQYPQPRMAETREEANRLAGEILSDGELANYNHELRTEGQSVLASEMVVSDQQVFDAIKANGGITIDVWTAGEPGTGIVVAPFKETETKIPLNNFTPQDVNDFMEKFRPLLEVPGMHLGGWISDDTVYLDVSIVTEDEVTATILAENGNQLAVFNIGTGESPSTSELVARNSGALAERRESPDLENLTRSLQQAFGRAVGGIQGANNRNVPAEGALPEIGVIEALTGEPATQDEINRIAESAARPELGGDFDQSQTDSEDLRRGARSGVPDVSGGLGGGRISKTSIQSRLRNEPALQVSSIQGSRVEGKLEGAPFYRISSPDIYSQILSDFVDKHPLGGQVKKKTPEQLAGAELYLSEDGGAGFALYPTGELGSLFKDPSAGGAVTMKLLRALRKQSFDFPVYAASFNTDLVPLYSRMAGMVPVARLPWETVGRTDGVDWNSNSEEFKNFENGKPSVVIWAFDPENAVGLKAADILTQFPQVASSYAEAVALAKGRSVVAPEVKESRAVGPEQYVSSVTNEVVTFPSAEEYFRNAEEVRAYVDKKFAPQIKALKSWVNDSVLAYEASYKWVGQHGRHYVEFNPVTMSRNTRRQVDAIMREETIHAASGLVLMRRGIEWGDFYEDLGNSLSSAQRSRLKTVYRSTRNNTDIGAEYFRASIQQLLYGKITEAEMKSTPMKKIIALILDFVNYFKQDDIPPLVREVYEESVRMLQKVDKGNAKQDVLYSEAVPAELGRLWQEAVAKEGGDAFAYGEVPPEATSFPDVLRAVLGDVSKNFSVGYYSDGADVSPEQWQALSSADPAELWIQDPKGGTTVFFSERATARSGIFAINSAGTKTQGSALYQALYAWAHNNGKIVGPDSSLSKIGQLRRSSQMLSSSLRFGTTQHLKPSYEQDLVGWRNVEVDENGTPWEIVLYRGAQETVDGLGKNSYNQFHQEVSLAYIQAEPFGSDDTLRKSVWNGYEVRVIPMGPEEAQEAWSENIGLLAKKEAQLVFERMPELEGLKLSRNGYLLGPDKNIPRSIKELPAGNTEEYLRTLLSAISDIDSKFTDRIGAATLARALATRFAEANSSNPSLRAADAEGSDAPRELTTFSPFRAVLYSEAVAPLPTTPMPMSAVDVLYNDSSALPKSEKKIKNSAVANLLEEVAFSYWGFSLNSGNITPEIEQILVTNGVNEFINALQASGKNAGDWYSTAIEVAMGVAGTIHPEISDAELAKGIPAFSSAKEPDKAAQLVMRIALAVTSQNLNVSQNAGYAEEQYAIFSSTGRFDSSKVYGEKAESISGNLELANQLVDILGFEGAETFIKEEFSIATLQKKASSILGRPIKISGKLDDIVNGAALFGPKIGQGFLQNLMGRFDPVTIDLWMRRTWGRWTGDVVGDGVTEERMARLLDAARDAGLQIPEALQSLRTVERKRKNKKPFRTMSEAVSVRLENDPEFRQSIIDLAAAFNSKGQAEYRLSGEPVTPEVAAWITKYTTPEWAQAQEDAYRAAVEREDTDAAKAIQRDTLEKAYRQLIRGQQRIKDGLNKKWDDLRKAGEKPAMPKAAWVAEQHTEAGRTEELGNKLIGSLKPKWSRSAKVILTDLNPIDIPSPQDRRVISRIVNKIRGELSNKGYTATNADVQAVLWYPEKDIWAKLRGEEESNLKLSYDDEFIAIAEERGLGQQARAVAERIRADRATRTGGQNDARTNEAVDQRADGLQAPETLASAPVPFQGNVASGFNPTVYTPADARKTTALGRVLSDPEYRSVQAALKDKRYFAWTGAETLTRANEFIDQANGGDLQKAFLNSATAYGLTAEQTILVRGLALKRAQAAANAARAEMAAPNTPPKRVVSLQFIEQHYSDLAEDFAESLMETASLAGQELRSFRLLADALAPKTWANTYKKAAQRAQVKKFSKDPVLKAMMDRVKAARQKAANSTTVRMQQALAIAAKRFLSEGTTDDEFKAHENFARLMASELSVREEVMQAAVEQTVVSGIETIRRAVAPGETIPDSFLREWENRLRKIATDQINAVIEQRLQGGQVDPEARELSEQEMEAERKQKLLDMWREFSDYPLAEIVFNLARSTIVASDSPYASLVRKAQFDPERIKNLRKAVQASINTAAEIRKSVADRRMSVGALKLRLAEANPSLTEEQLGRLAAAVEAVYNEEVARATRSALDEVVRRHSEKKTAKIVEQPDFLTQLLPLVNMGAFSDEAVYNAVADKLRLPTWNPDVAAEIEAKANALQALPEGSLQRQEAAQVLMSDILKANIKEARGAKLWGPIMQISSALWSAGILSGPPTQIVNASMSTVSVFAESLAEATGYWAAATANGATQEQARAYYGDIARAWLFAAGKDANNTSFRAINEVHNALTKGQSKFKSEKMENMSPLELFKFHSRVAVPGNRMMDAIISGEGKTALKEAVKMAVGVPVTMVQRVATADVKGVMKDYAATMKLVGRMMLAADGVNSFGAMTTKEMMMRRYLAQEEGMAQQEIDRVMREALQGGNEAIRDAALAQAEDEAQRGDFGPTGTTSHEVQKARRIEQLIEQQVYDSDTINAGRDFAAVATFNNDPYGVVGWIMDTLFAGPTKVLGIATKPINPFPKTVSNLINSALNFTPYGSLRAEGINLGTLVAQSRYYPQQFFKEAPERGTPEYYALHTRAAFGTAAVGVFTMMLLSAIKDRKEKKEPWFEIHGPGPSDLAARKQWAASGAKKFSVKIGTGDGAGVLNYADWPALNLVLGVLGTFYDEAVYGDLQTDPLDWLSQSLRAVVLTTLNRNFLGGAAGLFEILSASTPDKVASMKMGQLASSYATGFTRPSFVRWAETIATGTRQETGTAEGWLLSMTPVVSAFRDRPSLNILGEPIKITPWDATAGRIVSTQETHPILTPLTDAQLWITPAKAYPIYDPKSETMVRDMTKAEFYDYGKAYGEALQTMLPPEQVSELAELSKTAPNTAQEILNNLANVASTIAKSQMADRELHKGKELKGL